MLIRKIQNRISSEKGFTLIEMLIVIIILGILLAIAVPAYLKFKDRANNAAAQANIRAMVPAVEAYNADNNGYASMTIGGSGSTSLQATYDTALKGWDAATSSGVTILSKSASTYCVKSVVGNATYYKAGPASDTSATACT
jgi:type IV pilus assembly protein PilA